METTRLLLSLLRSCCGSKSLKQGELLHQKVITSGLRSNVALCISLIKFYFSCQLFKPAELVFRTTENPWDVSLWNSLMACYTKNYMLVEALELFEDLLHLPYLKPDSHTYPSVLKACSGLGRAGYGKVVHTHVVKSGFVSDVVVTSAIVGLYAKCGMFGWATQLFDEMPERDAACWNTVISSYYQNGQYGKALGLFDEMKGCGYKPDSVTYTTAICSCGRLLDLERGKEMHNEVVQNGLVLDGYVSAALVDMYGKSGNLEMAINVFEQMPRKSLVSWNSMIAAHSLSGDSKSCIDLFQRMIGQGIKPSSTTFSSLLMACSKSGNLWHGKVTHGYIMRNGIEADIFINGSLVDLYFKCGSIVSAEFAFKGMPRTDVVAWNIMISGYVSVGCDFEALGVFSDMENAGVKPNAITFTSVLVACSRLAALEQGKHIHKSIIACKLESHEIVTGALLDMYAKCGAVNEAFQAFNQLSERDLVSWTSMIMAYGCHGQAFEALNLFSKMLQSDVKPDRVTFLAVISACSHAGLVNEGCYYFKKMVDDYKINPTFAEYSCLVDLLGRAGRVHEAYVILQKHPNMREDANLLSTLFSACHLHGELELGWKIADLLLDKDADDSSTYITLAKMYASANGWTQARKVRLKMKELGLKKYPGCSWIEVGKRIEAFFVKDKVIPQAEMVYECLAILTTHMEKD